MPKESSRLIYPVVTNLAPGIFSGYGSQRVNEEHVQTHSEGALRFCERGGVDKSLLRTCVALCRGLKRLSIGFSTSTNLVDGPLVLLACARWRTCSSPFCCPTTRLSSA